MTEFPDRSRATFPVMTPMTTRWRDDDVYGHMNNTVYYEYFDTAVNMWLIEHSGLDIPHGPVIGLVAETGCRFLASVGFPEPLEVGLCALRVGRTSVVYGLGLFSAGAPEASAICRYAHVYVDAKTRRPTPLTAEFAAALATIPAGGA